MDVRGTIGIVQPASKGPKGGNDATAERWRHIFEELSWKVVSGDSWSGQDVDLLVALHAHKSYPSVIAFRSKHPDRPIIVAGTGTDIYPRRTPAGKDVPVEARERTDVSIEARRSLEFATRIVVLQDLNLGIAHAVMSLEHEGETLILDNQVSRVVRHEVIRHYKPIYSVNETHWWLHRA